MKAYILILEGYKKWFSDYLKMTEAVAGYGSFMSYTYAQKHDVRGVMKYAGYEKKKEKIQEKNWFQLVKMERQRREHRSVRRTIDLKLKKQQRRGVPNNDSLSESSL